MSEPRAKWLLSQKVLLGTLPLSQAQPLPGIIHRDTQLSEICLHGHDLNGCNKKCSPECNTCTEWGFPRHLENTIHKKWKRLARSSYSTVAQSHDLDGNHHLECVVTPCSSNKAWIRDIPTICKFSFCAEWGGRRLYHPVLKALYFDLQCLSWRRPVTGNIWAINVKMNKKRVFEQAGSSALAFWKCSSKPLRAQAWKDKSIIMIKSDCNLFPLHISISKGKKRTHTPSLEGLFQAFELQTGVKSILLPY